MEFALKRGTLVQLGSAEDADLLPYKLFAAPSSPLNPFVGKGGKVGEAREGDVGIVLDRTTETLNGWVHVLFRTGAHGWMNGRWLRVIA